jgi:tetratricopeptide (TPR) repeat protein
MEDIDRAINVASKAVENTPLNHPDRASQLCNLATWLSRRFERTGEMEDIERAIDVASKAVEITPSDHPDRARWLNNLGNKFGRLFERTGEIEDVDRAIDATSKAVQITPPDDPDRARYMSNLGSWFGVRFERIGNVEDIDQAIDIASKAVENTPLNHPERAGRLSNLGNRLGRRFERTGEIEDIDQAIDAASRAVEITPTDDPDRARYLSNLGSGLSRRFQWTGAKEDIDRAIYATGEAVENTPLDHPNRAIILNGLGSSLAMRFEQSGNMEDIDRAITIANTAMSAAFPNSPDRSGWLNNLANCFGARFERTGVMEDIDQAIDAASKAVEDTPTDDPDRAIFLNNLGNRLGRRFERTGAIEDLDKSIEVAAMAVDSTPLDHPNRATWLNNLGVWLGTRYERTGAMEDIDRSVDTANKAVEATTPNHPNRVRWLNNLASWLGARFDRTGQWEDIDRAVEVASKAVDAMAPDHLDRATVLNNLGNKLGTRSEWTRSKVDLDRAIDVAREAVEATALDDSNLAIWLNTLGIWLGKRFEWTGSVQDISEAIEIATMAADATPLGHPDRASRLCNLGSLLRLRFEHTGAEEDNNESLLAFKKGWNSRTSPPSVRIRSAREAAAIFSSRSQWDESSALIEQSVKLLPSVSPRYLRHTDQQHMLADFAGLASSAAATALNVGKDASYALELLELGRGVIASMLLEMRTDLSDLERQFPKLATEFVSLRDELDSPANTMVLLGDASAIEVRGKRRREAEKMFPAVLEEIRSKPGFENFLHPPLTGELKTAASSGPIVVVNVNVYRCDAFLVQQHGPIKALKLPNLHLKDIDEHAKSIRDDNPWKTLEWLWDVAASPILDELGFKKLPSNNSWPHIWWILAGQLTQMPFHAAGQYYKGSSNTVLDRVMSSYSPTIKALIYGRQYCSKHPTQQTSENALLVTVPGSGLPYALDEVKMLEGLCPFLKLKPVQPAPQRDEILTHLRACKVFHFASHGRSNPLEPSESCLVLEGENNSITVADLRDCRLQENSPFLAYLSACSTKVNEDRRLIDEEIHLVSACQLAGFRHVVGALWEVSDKYCVDVARVLYETIKDEGMSDSAVCLGLHRAIRELRDKDLVTTHSGEKSFNRNTEVNRDDTSSGDESIQHEVHNQSDAQTATMYDTNVKNNATGEIDRTHQEKVKINDDVTFTPRNSNNTVDPSGERKTQDNPCSGDDKSRQSHWGVPSGLPQIDGPLLWAAYIHVGV